MRSGCCRDTTTAEATGDAAIISLDVQTLPGSVTQIDVSVTP